MRRSAVPRVGPEPERRTRRPGAWVALAIGLSLAVELGVGALLVLEFAR